MNTREVKISQAFSFAHAFFTPADKASVTFLGLVD